MTEEGRKRMIKRELDELWDFTLENLRGNDWVLDRLDAIYALLEPAKEDTNEKV